MIDELCWYNTEKINLTEKKNSSLFITKSLLYQNIKFF